jgi:hypothetical protein
MYRSVPLRHGGWAPWRPPHRCCASSTLDVLVRPDTLVQFVILLRSDPDLDAVFGSYDTAPAAPGVLSQYRKLATSFRAPERPRSSVHLLGGLRRDSPGGFSGRWRLRSTVHAPQRRGYRARIPAARRRKAYSSRQAHKRWTFWGIVRADIRDRAVPWTESIARTTAPPGRPEPGLGQSGKRRCGLCVSVV